MAFDQTMCRRVEGMHPLIPRVMSVSMVEMYLAS